MLETTVPAEHQALGRKAKGFDRKKWDDRENCNWRLLGSVILLTGECRQEPNRGRWQLPQIHERQGEPTDAQNASRYG